jgi:cyanobactin maturation PatA/PatG family protease
MKMSKEKYGTKEEAAIHHLDYIKEKGNHGEGVRVAIIDSSIEKSHSLLMHLDIESEGDFKTDNIGHGTAVCSIIAGKGIGVANKSKIYSIPVFHENSDGNLQGCSELTLARAINQARRKGCQIINISGASLSLNGRGCDQLRQAVEECHSEGVIIIAAVGNEGVQQESLPASLETVLAVGGCDSDGMPLKFNNHGSLLIRKMLLAPGENVPVAITGDRISSLSGSSFSAPIITGMVALLLNVFNRDHSKVAAEKIKALLFETASVLKPEVTEKQFFKIHRLNISALVQRVKQELTTSTHYRNEFMSTEENSIVPSAIVDSKVHDEITPMNYASSEVASSGSAGHPSSSALTLPDIHDSAVHNYVHAPITNIVPQMESDARSARAQEKVFLIGTLGYDFGTEARLDYFTQVMGNQKGHPFDPVQMATHLTANDNIEQADALIWTLKVDGIPIYALKPDSQFSVLEYARMVEFLNDQETKGVERVSVAGIVCGETRLFNGQYVPTVSPVLRGMFNWKSRDLTKLIMGDEAIGSPKADELMNFINRIYYELRNRGFNSHERAINYAATNAYQMREIFDDAFDENLFLNKISAVTSPVSRPESDCWDVVLEFFNPKERLTTARKLYRYTIDVSDIMPVTIGTLRSWYAY